MIEIDWKPRRGELRKFGVVMLVGFGIVGGILLWRAHPTTAYCFWGVGVLVCALAIAAPCAALPVYWVWMGIALIMGTVVNLVVLTLVYYLIFTPAGLTMRLFGRDALERKRDAEAESYLVDHKSTLDSSRYERQF